MIEMLFRDLEATMSKDQEKVFWLGIILLSERSGKYVVVDGQQRILTMFLTFQSFLEDFKAEGLEDENNKYKIYKSFEGESKFIASETVIRCIKDKYCPEFFNKKKQDNIDGKLEKRIELIKNYGKQIIDRKGKFTFFNYLKKVKCAVLLLPDESYSNFEDINSKTVKLTLTEKCLAFLLSKEKEMFESGSRNLFSWLIENKVIESDEFFEKFTNAYKRSQKQAKEVTDNFLSFKFFFENETKAAKIFLEFLTVTKQLVEGCNENQGFGKIYLREVCLKDYWVIYVKSKVEQNTRFIKYFLDTIWKFDLIRYLNGIDKNPIKKQVLDLVSVEVTKSKYHQFLISNMSGKYKRKGEKIILSYSENITKISNLKKTNQFEKRLKTFIFILYIYNKTEGNEPNFYFYFIKNKNLVIKNLYTVKDSEVEDNTEKLEKLANMCLLEKDNQFDSKLIEEKINHLEDSAYDYPKLYELKREIIGNFKKTVTEGKDLKRCEAFWKKRNGSLQLKLNLIRKQHLRIEFNLSNHKQEENNKKIIDRPLTMEERKEIENLFIKKNNLSKTENKGLFVNEEGELFYLRYFIDGNPKKSRRRVIVRPKVYKLLKESIRNGRKPKIIGYENKNGKFYSYKNWEKFMRYSDNPDNHPALPLKNNDWIEFWKYQLHS